MAAGAIEVIRGSRLVNNRRNLACQSGYIRVLYHLSCGQLYDFETSDRRAYSRVAQRSLISASLPYLLAMEFAMAAVEIHKHCHVA